MLRVTCYDCKAIDEIALSSEYLYKVTCKNGHKGDHLFLNFKFDLLFDSALNALNDGYYREAVSSFYASLENFYIEFTTLLIIEADIKIDTDHYNETFKKHIGFSERKIGAFYLLYLILMNEVPTPFSTELVSFRNKVIHGTKYPTKDETLNFGHKVRDHIFSVWRNLADKFTGIDMTIDINKIDKFTEALSGPTTLCQTRCYLSNYVFDDPVDIVEIDRYESNLQSYRERRRI